jgi:hypothetical protein
VCKLKIVSEERQLIAACGCFLMCAVLWGALYAPHYTYSATGPSQKTCLEALVYNWHVNHANLIYTAPSTSTDQISDTHMITQKQCMSAWRAMLAASIPRC